MNFLKDNQPIILVALLIVAIFVGAAGMAHDYRGGNPRAHIHFSWSK